MHPSTGKVFASAKISRPRGNRPMLRPRLFQRLDDLRAAALIWITGPPGAGKTTLTSSYLAERSMAGLWYQIDPDDADIATFFHYLGLAVQQLAGIGAKPLPTLEPAYLPGLASFTRRFAETMVERVARPTTIVLDNYELLPADAPLHDVVRDLAAALPPGWNMVVLSRSEPPPAFARARVHQDLVLISGHELDLNPGEARQLVAARNQRALGAAITESAAGETAGTAAEADDSTAELLMRETGGWLAGFTLLLAQRSGPNPHDAAGKNQQLLFHYFASELFTRLSPDQQTALLHTSLLPAMTLAEAERMAQSTSIGALLERLHRQNCFVVQRGEEEASYEYHALFRAFLLDRAAASMPADEWRCLQCRAADLLAASARPDAAAGLYRAAAAWERLAALVLLEAKALVLAGRHHTLAHWLADLPPQLLQRSSWLQYWQGASRLPFDGAAARGFFEQAYAGFQREEDAVGLYTTWASVMETFFFELRDFRPADRWIAEFESLRSRHPEFPSRAVELRTYWATGTLLHRQPWHPLLPAWAERALVLLDPADRDLSVLIGGYLVIWLMWRGETAKAAAVIARVVPWTEPDMSTMVLILWSCAVALFHSAQGDSSACRPAVEAGLRMAEHCGVHGFDYLLGAQMARCSLVAGDPQEAQAWLARMAPSLRQHSAIELSFYRHLQSNTAAQQGQWQQALDLAREGVQTAVESGVPYVEAHCHIDLARALLGSGNAPASVQHIAAAREIGTAMRSRVVLYLCLEAEAEAAFASGDDARGQRLLSTALAEARAMGGATWRMSGPQSAVRLYDRALDAHIEVQHVRQLIRQQGLMPADPATAADSWPWPVRVYTLGRFEICVDEQVLVSARKAQRKPLELLKCLCALGGQAVNQDRLTDALWPDTEGDAADQALRTTLHRLRKLLGHEQALRFEDRHLHLDTRVLWADCLIFDRVAHLPRSADRDHLQRLLSRYRGPFLDGESAAWAINYRHRLHAGFLALAEHLVSLHERADDWPAAVDACRRVIEVDPVAEAFYRRLMAAQLCLGRRAEALGAYEQCRGALLGRLGISPAAETQALYRRLVEA